MSFGSGNPSEPGAVGLWPRLRDLVRSLPEGPWRDLQEARLRRLRDRRIRRLEDLIALVEDEGADVEDRVAACWFLGRLQQPEATPALCRAMTHGPRPVRLAACYAAVDMDDRGAVACLERALAGDPDAEVRKAAAYALGWLRDRAAVLSLLETLRNRGETAEVRGMAAEQLGRLEDERAVPTLRQALRDEQTEVRFWAAYALGRLGSNDVIGDLEALADRDAGEVPGQGSVRDEALEAIQLIRQRSLDHG
jgi:HEAT repeat protein